MLGKVHFRKKINEFYKFPLYHLDLILNKSDKTTIIREEFDNKLNKILKENLG